MKKRFLFFLLLAAMALSVCFVSCDDDDDDDDGGGDSGGSPTITDTTPATPSEDPAKDATSDTPLIIKNEVQIYEEGNADKYFEYLTFTSGTGGTYALYKQTGGTGALTAVTGSLDIGKDSITIPTTFTFTSATCTLSIGQDADAVTSYMFFVDNKYITAAEKLTPKDSAKTGLFDVWKTEDETYQISDKGVLTIIESGGDDKGGDIETATGYTKDKAGVLSSPNTPFKLAYEKVGANNALYTFAQTAEKTTAAGARASALSNQMANVVTFKSNRFLLLKI